MRSTGWSGAALGSEPPAQLQRGQHARGLGAPQPVLGLEVGQRPLREAADPALEEMGGGVEGRRAGGASPQQERRRGEVGERAGAVAGQALARTLLGRNGRLQPLESAIRADVHRDSRLRGPRQC